jgi:hypothetical protein
MLQWAAIDENGPGRGSWSVFDVMAKRTTEAPMRVLDLDLDIFLNEVAYHRSAKDGRLDSTRYSAWSREAVESFLKEQCRLDPGRPIRGRVVTDHSEEFPFWRGLVESGDLAVPFEVVHVDAHSDLGCGDSGYVYLMTDILNRDVDERRHPDIGRTKMNSGNFLAFALACRRIDILTFVPHPDAHADLFEWYFQHGDSRSGIIQLKAVPPELPQGDPFWLMATPNMEPTEPDIPFRLVALQNFTAEGSFDFVPFWGPHSGDTT